ncbi:hypothetical protein BRC83_06600 [Halobacteriales archaeon QS_1_68_17]|nr:MAG: hypothetical protein BRC83_06600 [Halobacteriales archaeon QS_1_68_17]
MTRQLHGRTLIELYRTGDEWEVTQAGVGVVGTGPTAGLAAADYCRRIAEVDADGSATSGT